MLGLILANPAEEPSDELDDDPPEKELDELFYTPATLGIYHYFCIYFHSYFYLYFYQHSGVSKCYHNSPLEE